MDFLKKYGLNQTPSVCDSLKKNVALLDNFSDREILSLASQVLDRLLSDEHIEFSKQLISLIIPNLPSSPSEYSVTSSDVSVKISRFFPPEELIDGWKLDYISKEFFKELYLNISPEKKALLHNDLVSDLVLNNIRERRSSSKISQSI